MGSSGMACVYVLLRSAANSHRLLDSNLANCTLHQVLLSLSSQQVNEGEELYSEAMSLLNSSAPGNRKKAWDMMDEAAALGHVGARVRIAWAKFAGNSTYNSPSVARYSCLWTNLLIFEVNIPWSSLMS